VLTSRGLLPSDVELIARSTAVSRPGCIDFRSGESLFNCSQIVLQERVGGRTFLIWGKPSVSSRSTERTDIHMAKGRTFYTGFVVTFLGVSALTYAQTSSPAFDGSSASREVEKLICADEELAALDRKMADTFQKALESFPREEAVTQRTRQRGWIKGRNGCGKADDVKSCLVQEHRTRIVAPNPVGSADGAHTGRLRPPRRRRQALLRDLL
jgi:uncharacterized protein YecT (DUF1311 family)